MFFNSLPFIFIFLPAVITLYFLVIRQGDKKFGQFTLLAASVFFYFLLTPEYLPLLIASISFNFLIGYLMIQCKKPGGLEDKVGMVLWAGIVVDLLLLGYYKYFSFVLVNLDSFGLGIPIPAITLPLGISFFTFTQIAFLVDTYRGKVQKIDPLSYFQFVTFFPHLIAGPIYHHAEIIPQFEDPENKRINWINMNLGAFFFFFGLAKKVIIADALATMVNPIFSAVGNGAVPLLLESWIGALAFTLQLYFDFSGYSDMAVGIALFFNIWFPLNFFSPYKVTSIIDFWRSWHITLSNWLRDYLYIPLGGNRYGFPAQMRSLFITFLLGGLWHGAGWTFIIWGGLHGVFLIINHAWRRMGIVLNQYICWIITFFAVVIGWVFFRADSPRAALMILQGMSGLNGISVPKGMPGFDMFAHAGIFTISPVSGFMVIYVVIGLFIVFFLPNLYEIAGVFSSPLIKEKQLKIARIDPFQIRVTYRQSIRWIVLVAIVASAAIIWIQTTSDFLYFQF